MSDDQEINDHSAITALIGALRMERLEKFILEKNGMGEQGFTSAVRAEVVRLMSDVLIMAHLESRRISASVDDFFDDDEGAWADIETVLLESIRDTGATSEGLPAFRGMLERLIAAVDDRAKSGK